MEIEGMIIRDLGQFEGISKAGNPWKKHEWLLETSGNFPRKVKFTVFGEKVNTITFELGKSYSIQVDVESREYNERWYTDLTAYACRQIEPGMNPAEGQNIYAGQQTQPTPAAGPVFSQTATTAPAENNNPFGVGTPDFSQGDSQEDLPF